MERFIKEAFYFFTSIYFALKKDKCVQRYTGFDIIYILIENKIEF